MPNQKNPQCCCSTLRELESSRAAAKDQKGKRFGKPQRCPVRILARLSLSVRENICSRTMNNHAPTAQPKAPPRFPTPPTMRFVACDILLGPPALPCFLTRTLFAQRRN